MYPSIHLDFCHVRLFVYIFICTRRGTILIEWSRDLIAIVHFHLLEGEHGYLWWGDDSFSSELILAAHLGSYNGRD